MDPHLNLFYSYQKGDSDDIEGQKRLEDNLTRAFLVTLAQLKDAEPVKFCTVLTMLLGMNSHEIAPQDVSFGIQNLKADELKKIRRTKRKIILTIGGSPFGAESFYNKLDKFKNDIDYFENLTNDERKNQLSKIRSYQRQLEKTEAKESAVTIGGKFYEYPNLPTLYELLHECRPDGWIHSKHFVVLIESKIGNAPQNEHQIYRHLSSEKGFKLKRDDITNIFDNLHIHKTWEDIGIVLTRVAPQNPVVKEFYRFLIIVGEIMGLNEIIDNEFNEEIINKQFPLFLKNLDKKIKEFNKGLVRGKRPKENLWDYYGLGKDAGGNVCKNPHYSIYFTRQDMGISLTISDGKHQQMRKFLKSDNLLDYLTKIAIKIDDQFTRQRIVLALRNYRIVDHIKGQQRGSRQNTFDFEFVLSEIVGKKNSRSLEKDIRKVLNNMAECACFAKQLDFGYRILLPDFGKEPRKGGLYEANVNLLNTDNVLVDLYSEFINETKDLFDLILKNPK